MFQIESPGQRELSGKLGPRRFDDLIVDIPCCSVRPVKSDMITFSTAFTGGARAGSSPQPDPGAGGDRGRRRLPRAGAVIVAETTGASLAGRRGAPQHGHPAGRVDVEAWWRPAAAARGYTAAEDRDRIWEVLKSFAGFGFCKAHAAAFALPTFRARRG